MSNKVKSPVSKVQKRLKMQYPNEHTFLQSIEEVFESLESIGACKSRTQCRADLLLDEGLLQRLVEPEHIASFRVDWTDSSGQVQVNRGWRVAFHTALGPAKGGLRFHPNVTLSDLKFLAFEQSFKNALTGLPLGGGKGGADFDPSGRSTQDIMRFCNAFMIALHRHLGERVDVPAGDIGVGSREIGWLFGAWRRVTRKFEGVITGKCEGSGGSPLRPESTGWGLVYFTEAALQEQGSSLRGQTCVITGSGNVAINASRKVLEFGGTVLTLSDSKGWIHAPKGLQLDHLNKIERHKSVRGSSLADIAEDIGAVWNTRDRGSPCDVPCTVAFPCATQNEIDGCHAKSLVAHGVKIVGEGANMPLTPTANECFTDAGIPVLPGKAANAGGVIVSGFEMSQNAQHLTWTREEIDQRLRNKMQEVHNACMVAAASVGQAGNYRVGADVAGFKRLAEALQAQGTG